MEPGELNVDTRLGTLSINGYSCFQPHFAISDPVALLDLAELRGADRLVPHTVGVLARRRRSTATRKDFPIAITGWCDLTGAKVPASQRYGQLIVNKEAVATALGIGEGAPAGQTGVVTALWDRSALGVGLPNLSGPVHVMAPWRLELHTFVAVGVLSISIPAGKLT